MKYYIIAGEASGDLHASNLMKEMKKQDVNAEFRCWGGDLMQAQGGTIVKHYRELAFMGFTEVLMNLRTILKNIDLCKKDILEYKPDAVILVDYPGFNLRIAEFAKQKGFKVIYYISPSVWAWKSSRVYKIKASCDRMFCILPFEKDFYKKYDYNADFVGHPLLDAIGDRNVTKPTLEAFSAKHKLSGKPIISLLPGSRRQEILHMLPVMLAVSKKFPQYEFVIAGAPSLPMEVYAPHIGTLPVKVIFGETYNILEQSHAALVTSGTATLEAALFGVPEVVCYKGGAISYMIAKQLVKVKYISLVNLVLDKPVVKELIQADMTEQRVEEELRKILDGTGREKMKEEYAGLRKKLGDTPASATAAALIQETLKGK